MRVWSCLAAAALVPALVSCGGDDPPRTRVLMNFDRPTGLYDAPFPSDDLLVDGVVDVAFAESLPRK